jgi:O-acetyl-ADP-ribose deacetylase (regulator of RNase III)
MITEARGNLLNADVDALVNTVNTSGVMGKGVALQFRRVYPEMFTAYQRAVEAGEVTLGRVLVWSTESLVGPSYVINFPTKGHWKSRSRLADIETGLRDLVRVVRDLGITSLALPPLGCGNGGLDWRVVEPRIRAAFAHLDDVHVVLYPPGHTPAAAEMLTRTELPAMTAPRAALIRILKLYSERAIEVTLATSLVEVQKLLYFLQVAGEPLRLHYVRARYGPYADNLRHALSMLEGHYLLGFGDGSAKVADAEPIRVLPGADERAAHALMDHPETIDRIWHVLNLIDGFESAYGMELLASVHWIVHEVPETASDPVLATRLVREWSPRKGRMFTAEHVRTAWNTLDKQGWMPAPRLCDDERGPGGRDRDRSW